MQIANILIFIVLFIFFGCKVSDPIVYDNPPIKLDVYDVGVNEAYLKIVVPNSKNNLAYTLQRDGQHLFNFLAPIDTIIADTTVKQGMSYSYKIEPDVLSSVRLISKEVKLNTKLPTNHCRTWETYTFGDLSSGYFKDVAIINENDIWAVGEFYLKDSTGKMNDEPINAVHWNGNHWELKRIVFQFFYGSGVSEATGVIAFDSNNILISDGGCVMKWDGAEWNSLGTIMTSRSQIGSANKMWGTSARNLYGVGLNGSIIHFDGQKWERIESHTDVNINDIWGIVDFDSGEEMVYCAATNNGTIGDRKILKIDKNKSVSIIPWDLNNNIMSLWTKKGFPIYTCGGGVFNNRNGNWLFDFSVPNIYTEKIRGNSLNDIFVCGDFGLLGHFNGIEWNFYNKGTIPNSAYLSMAVKDNIVVAVGYSGSKALIVKSTK